MTPQQAFEDAWNAPTATRFIAPTIDVNAALANEGSPWRMTQRMAWDAEVRKAMAPHHALPEQFATSHMWGRTTVDGRTTFIRASEQRAWDGADVVLVLEAILIDDNHRRMWFQGLPQAVSEDGTVLHANEQQPLFHVEHSVGGTPDTPLLSWRIVHDTIAPDASVVARLQDLNPHAVPAYVTAYLTDRTAMGSPSSRSVSDAREAAAAHVAWTQPFGPHGPEMAVVWGDPKTGPHGSLLRFRPGAVAGLHVHPHDSYGVVVEGMLVHTYQGQPPGEPLGPGSWYFEPAGVPHVSTCGVEGPCVVLVHNPGPFGFEPVTDAPR